MKRKFKQEKYRAKKAKMFSVTILVTGVPNKNNRVYNKAAIEELLKSPKYLPQAGLTGLKGLPSIINGDMVTDMGRVAFTIKDLRFEGDKLMGKVVPNHTSAGKELLKDFDHYSFRLNSYGEISESKDGNHVEVKVIAIHSVSALPKDNAA